MLVNYDNKPMVLVFLNVLARCSNEELLDRLFRKSVVTEAEVPISCHFKISKYGRCTPKFILVLQNMAALFILSILSMGTVSACQTRMNCLSAHPESFVPNDSFSME